MTSRASQWRMVISYPWPFISPLIGGRTARLSRFLTARGHFLSRPCCPFLKILFSSFGCLFLSVTFCGLTLSHFTACRRQCGCPYIVLFFLCAPIPAIVLFHSWFLNPRLTLKFDNSASHPFPSLSNLLLFLIFLLRGSILACRLLYGSTSQSMASPH